MQIVPNAVSTTNISPKRSRISLPLSWATSHRRAFRCLTTAFTCRAGCKERDVSKIHNAARQVQRLVRWRCHLQDIKSPLKLAPLVQRWCGLNCFDNVTNMQFNPRNPKLAFAPLAHLVCHFFCSSSVEYLNVRNVSDWRVSPQTFTYDTNGPASPEDTQPDIALRGSPRI